MLNVVILALTGCGIHAFDESQVPKIQVSPGTRPVISWTPEQAYSLNVYAGTEDGDGLNVLWQARSPEYANQLNSPVTYGVAPVGTDGQSAAPLEVGKTYTVTVQRKDPLGTGDGFTNTHKRYVGKQTFTVQ
ncbi:MAG: hypothetical protein R3F02_11260 [Thiolinea sp.]